MCVTPESNGPDVGCASCGEAYMSFLFISSLCTYIVIFVLLPCVYAVAVVMLHFLDPYVFLFAGIYWYSMDSFIIVDGVE